MTLPVCERPGKTGAESDKAWTNVVLAQPGNLIGRQS